MGRGWEVSAANEQKVWATLHPLALMLMSKRDKQPSAASLPRVSWGGAGFCQSHLQFCQNKGTLASREACFFPENQGTVVEVLPGSLCIQRGRMCCGCAGKASPHCACASSENSPIPEHAAVLLPACAQALSPNHQIHQTTTMG